MHDVNCVVYVCINVCMYVCTYVCMLYVYGNILFEWAKVGTSPPVGSRGSMSAGITLPFFFVASFPDSADDRFLPSDGAEEDDVEVAAAARFKGCSEEDCFVSGLK